MTVDNQTKRSALVDPLKAVQAAVSNPMVRDVVGKGLEARDAALRTQTAMLGAMNLPTADDVESLKSQLRSVSQRLELLEDAVDRVDENLTRVLAELKAMRADSAGA